MALIIDVSAYQGQVDWSAVLASGRIGAIAKATEALGYVDPTFARNWAALGSLNATRGAYCFARPASTVAEVQADKFLKVVGPTKPGDILVLDLEVGDGNLSDWALRWLGRVQAATGITPWLYSYGPFIRAHLTDPRLAAYPLWLAAYQTNPPPAPPPWTSYVLWQRSSHANVPGVSGPCDESIGDLIVPASEPKVRAMYDPPIGPIAAVWQDDTGKVIAAVSPDGDVYAWGCKWAGNVRGKPYWADRKAALIGPPEHGGEYVVTAVGDGTEKYELPDGIDKL